MSGEFQSPFNWPNGARCAVAITLDMDADSLVHVAHPKDSHNKRISTTSWLRYGPEVAIPRILQSYRDLGLTQSFFIPAWCMEQYPQTVEAILKDGHEIGHHGYIHEAPNSFDREGERYWLERGIDVFERLTGQKPKGWRAPLYNVSESSIDLLIEAGFDYDASLMGDDNPYLLNTGKGELVELPTHWGLDDWPPFVYNEDIEFTMPIQPPGHIFQGFREDFDAAWQEGGAWITPWHPFVVGRRGRWPQVVKLIEHMQNKGDVWFATMSQIAEHIKSQSVSQPESIRRVDYPLYKEAINIDHRL